MTGVTVGGIFACCLIAWVFVSAFRGLSGRRSGSTRHAAMICPHCGTRGNPTRRTRGHFAIELLLWLCFFIPGIIYSLWRITTRYDACPACGQGGMIPADSPLGKRLTGEP